MNHIDAEHVVMRHPNVASAELDGEVVLFDETTDALHLLNPTAAAVWLRIDGLATVRELAADLAAAFGADPEVVRRDLMALLRELDSDGLLAEVGARNGGRVRT